MYKLSVVCYQWTCMQWNRHGTSNRITFPKSVTNDATLWMAVGEIGGDILHSMLYRYNALKYFVYYMECVAILCVIFAQVIRLAQVLIQYQANTN